MAKQRARLVLLIALAAPVHAHAQEETAAQPPTSPAAVQQAHKARFSALVAKAERERRAGRLAEAASAYAEAFELEQDPLVAGRLGVLLVELGNPTEAADLLLDGIERATDAPAAERQKFLKAYDTARARVCRVEVTVSEAHAEISLDGVVKQTDGITGFTMFLPPGEHELRAKLKGFEDGVSSFTAPKGGTLRVELALVPAATPSPASSPALSSSSAAAPSPASSPAPSMPPPSSPRPAPSSASSPPPRTPDVRRWVPTFGATAIYGAVSPLPAFGFTASAERQHGETYSLRLEVRGAISPTQIGGSSIRGAVVGAWPALCATVRRFSGCLVGTAGALGLSATRQSLSMWSPFVGFGAGGSLLFASVGPADLRLALDAEVLLDDYPLRLGGQTVWTGPQILSGLNLAVLVVR